MKKLFIGLGALLSTFTLLGCENNETGAAGTDNNGGTNGSDERVEVKLWFDSSKDNSHEVIVAAIEEALPHIKIKYESVTPMDSVGKLALDGPAGLGADVFAVVHDQMADAMDAGLLLPVGEELSSFIDTDITENAASTVKFEDTYYGVPNETATIGFFYNKTLLDELGLEVASDWSEVIEQAEVFNDPSQNKYIVRLDVDDAYVTHFFLTANNYELFGPNHNDPTKVNFDTEAVLNGLNDFKALKDILPVPAGDLNWDTIHGEFVKGNLPYMVSGPWSIPDLEANNVDFEYGMTTIPTVNGKQAKTFSGNGIFGISSYTDCPDEAKEVVEFLTSEKGAQLFYEEKLVMPALKDFSQVPGLADDKNLEAVAQQAINSQPMPNIPEISKYWEPAANMFASVWDELLTPEEAMKKAAEEYDMLIEMSK